MPTAFPLSFFMPGRSARQRCWRSCQEPTGCWATVATTQTGSGCLSAKGNQPCIPGLKSGISRSDTASAATGVQPHRIMLGHWTKKAHLHAILTHPFSVAATAHRPAESQLAEYGQAPVEAGGRMRASRGRLFITALCRILVPHG
jgi:hypothetical protein